VATAGLSLLHTDAFLSDLAETLGMELRRAWWSCHSLPREGRGEEVRAARGEEVREYHNR